MRTVGTSVYGLRTPIIKEGDDLVSIVVDAVAKHAPEDGVVLRDGDIVGVTEAVLARAQGNYATIDDVARDVRRTFPSGAVGVVFPILSRNRFAMQLKGIAGGADRVVVQLSYPADEVGNALFSYDDMEEKGVNPATDVLDVAHFRRLFGDYVPHRFTGVDYVDYYAKLNDNISIILANDPRAILKYTNQVISADIHTRYRTKRVLKRAGASVIGLEDILCAPSRGCGYNADYGLLGSNKATEERIKLFPRDCDEFVTRVQQGIYEASGKRLEVLVYGDGGFKDPVGGIWELADPVISPAYTEGLRGTPNELKLKYLADSRFAELSGDEARAAMVRAIREKGSLMGKMESEGTTPRQFSDLLGSLCDLTSGSGDKGTPVVLIQGYFDNYASDNSPFAILRSKQRAQSQ